MEEVEREAHRVPAFPSSLRSSGWAGRILSVRLQTRGWLRAGGWVGEALARTGTMQEALCDSGGAPSSSGKETLTVAELPEPARLPHPQARC